jgi:hypothetical protein
MKNILPEGADIVIRFHDARRLGELKTAIFSLTMQTYRPLAIHLCLQRFTTEEIDFLRDELKPFFSIEEAPELIIHNWNGLLPRDARSVLVNLGISHAKYRFLTFLDYDDALYPEALGLLSSKLSQSMAAIAFASIQVKQIEMYPYFLFSSGRGDPFLGSNLLDLFENNFCPIHSFMIDRSNVEKHFLQFDEMINMGEDYDFLLRFCANFKSDFSLIGTFIGSYNYKNDGSNTVVVDSNAGSHKQATWMNFEYFLEGRRRVTEISPEVQKQLGISPARLGLTVRELLNDTGRLLPRTSEPITVGRAQSLVREIWREFVPYKTRAKIARIRRRLR